MPRKLEASMSNVEFLNRTMMIRMFVPGGEAQPLYDLQAELQKAILKRLDDYREAKG